MQQFIDKLISRLEEVRMGLGVVSGERMVINMAIDIVNQLAEEYKPFGNSEQVQGGWIPCSERLPKVNRKVFVAFKVAQLCEKTIDYDIGYLSSYDGKWYCDHKGYDVEKVLAWMPLPVPYGGERKTLTNADKIRNMNDEELAKYLYLCPVTLGEGDCIHSGEDVHCFDCILDWLQSEVKE